MPTHPRGNPAAAAGPMARFSRFARFQGNPRFATNAFAEGPSEQIAAIEAVASTEKAIVPLVDAPVLSDGLASTRKAIVGLADSPALGNALAAQLKAVVGLVDSPAFNSSLALVKLAVISLSETEALTGTIASTRKALVSPSESLTLSDSSAVVWRAHPALIDAVSLSEAQTSGKRFARVTSESWGGIGEAGASFASVYFRTDVIVLSEALTVRRSSTVAAGEAVAFSGALSLHVFRVVSVSEAIPAWSDSLSLLSERFRPKFPKSIWFPWARR